MVRRALQSDAKKRLIAILSEGCQCEGEHHEPEDATSLACLAGNALHDLERMERQANQLEVELFDIRNRADSALARSESMRLT